MRPGHILPIFAACLLLASCGTSKTAAVSPAKEFPNVAHEGRTAIVAHRGYWNCAAAGFAENSLASLREAQAEGFWGSECDVHLTSDDIVVVHHDAIIRGRRIHVNSFDSFSPHRLKNGEPLPTLDEYLVQAKESGRTVLVIELKPQENAAREDKLVELTLKSLREQGLYLPERINFISFSKHICELIAKQCPEFTNQYLNGDLSPEQLAAAGINGLDYEQSVIYREPSIVARAHALGMSVNVWTVDMAKDLRFFIQLGVDAITTNEPMLLRELLDNKEFKN
ncbi:MAG: glycerophosphodiester phosphodiesterase [Bacteroidales bacterium]|nr:glycerophosphodiester phosphodiesterase [Bacteroidales bacterium]